MIQRRVARWVLRDYSPLSSVSNMLDRLEWQTLEHRRSCARLTLFYKIVHHLVAVPLPQYLVQPLRLSRRSHPYGFRQLSTPKDYYKYIFVLLLSPSSRAVELPPGTWGADDWPWLLQGRHLFPPPPQTIDHHMFLAVNTSLLTFWHLISFFPAQHF